MNTSDILLRLILVSITTVLIVVDAITIIYYDQVIVTPWNFDFVLNFIHLTIPSLVFVIGFTKTNSGTTIRILISVLIISLAFDLASLFVRIFLYDLSLIIILKIISLFILAVLLIFSMIFYVASMGEEKEEKETIKIENHKPRKFVLILWQLIFIILVIQNFFYFVNINYPIDWTIYLLNLKWLFVFIIIPICTYDYAYQKESQILFLFIILSGILFIIIDIGIFTANAIIWVSLIISGVSIFILTYQIVLMSLLGFSVAITFAFIIFTRRYLSTFEQ